MEVLILVSYINVFNPVPHDHLRPSSRHHQKVVGRQVGSAAIADNNTPPGVRAHARRSPAPLNIFISAYFVHKSRMWKFYDHYASSK